MPGGVALLAAEAVGAGVTPDQIRSLEDLKRLPSSPARTSGKLPCRWLVVPMDRCRLHASTGTTGKRKVLVYTAKDIDDWRTCRPLLRNGRAFQEDRVQICVGYGVWTAGVGFQLGCERSGHWHPGRPGDIDCSSSSFVDFRPGSLLHRSMRCCCPGDPQARPRDKIHVER